MHRTLILLGKDLLHFWRDKAHLAITFLVPVVLIYLFGHVFGLYRKDSAPTGINLAVVNLSPEPAAQNLIRVLKAEKAFRVITETKDAGGASRPLTEADVRAGLRDNQYHFALLLPADLVSDSRFGLRMRFLFDPRNDIEAQTVNGLLQKIIFSNVPELLGQSLQRGARHLLGGARAEQFNRTIANDIADHFGGDREAIYQRIASGGFLLDDLPQAGAPAATGAPPAAGADLFSRIVRIDSEQVAGKNTKNPMAARTVGGYAIMFLLFAVSGSAVSLFEEKAAGLYQRLLAGPVRRAHILWSKFLFGILLGLVQIGTLFLVGELLFGLELFSHLGALLAVSVAAAAACTGFGMLIAAVVPSPGAAQGIATLLILVMSAVGGAWFPVSFMPEYVQSFSRLTIVYWAVEAFTDVLWAGQTLLDVLPKVGVLAGIAAAAMAVAVWRFNKGRIFD